MNSECCICFEIVRSSENQKPFATRCGHIFHENCIKSCIVNQGKCPQCNQNVHSSQLIRLFVNHPETSIEAKDELIERLKSQLNELNEKAQLQYDLIGSLNRQISHYEEKSNVACFPSAKTGAMSREIRVAKGHVAPAKLKVEDKSLLEAASSTLSFSTNSDVRIATKQIPTAWASGPHPWSSAKCDAPSNLDNTNPSPFSTNFDMNITTDSPTDIISQSAFGSMNIFGNSKGINSKFPFRGRNLTENQTSAGVNMSTSSSALLTNFESVSLEAKRDLYKEIGRLIFGDNSFELSKPFEFTQRVKATPKNDFTRFSSSQNPKPTTASSSLEQHLKPRTGIFGNSSQASFDTETTKNKIGSDSTSVAPATGPSNLPSFGGSAIFNTGLKPTLFASNKVPHTTSAFDWTPTTPSETLNNVSSVHTKNLFMPPENRSTKQNFGCIPKTSKLATITGSPNLTPISSSGLFDGCHDKTKTANILNKSSGFENTSLSSNLPSSSGFFTDRKRFVEPDLSAANLNKSLNTFFSSIPKGSFLSEGPGNTSTETISKDNIRANEDNIVEMAETE